MRSEFRAARQRRLIKRGIALWNHTEAAYLAARAISFGCMPGGSRMVPPSYVATVSQFPTANRYHAGA